MSYKEDQQKTKELLKPKVIKPGFGLNRERRRKRFINRLYTKRGYRFGMRIQRRAV